MLVSSDFTRPAVLLRRGPLGGAETSHAALSSFVAAMILYPEVQKRGQQELEKFAPSRLPVFEDLPHMPYVRAIMLEVLRSGSRLSVTLVFNHSHG